MANLEYVNQILSAQRNASEQKVMELKGNILSLQGVPIYYYSRNLLNVLLQFTVEMFSASPLNRSNMQNASSYHEVFSSFIEQNPTYYLPLIYTSDIELGFRVH